jgi:hypothetical protein
MAAVTAAEEPPVVFKMDSMAASLPPPPTSLFKAMELLSVDARLAASDELCLLDDIFRMAFFTIPLSLEPAILGLRRRERLRARVVAAGAAVSRPRPLVEAAGLGDSAAVFDVALTSAGADVEMTVEAAPDMLITEVSLVVEWAL